MSYRDVMCLIHSRCIYTLQIHTLTHKANPSPPSTYRLHSHLFCWCFQETRLSDALPAVLEPVLQHLSQSEKAAILLGLCILQQWQRFNDVYTCFNHIQPHSWNIWMVRFIWFSFTSLFSSLALCNLLGMYLMQVHCTKAREEISVDELRFLVGGHRHRNMRRSVRFLSVSCALKHSFGYSFSVKLWLRIQGPCSGSLAEGARRERGRG